MCDHHQLRPSGSSGAGEVDHVNHLSEDIGALYMKDEYSDITLKIESERFYAHKVVLAARSEYFRAMLFGGMRESSPTCCEIELQQTDASAFRHLLKYIYTGKMNLAQLKEETLLSVLELSHQYLLFGLEASISTYLTAILSVRNVCMIYDMASMYGLKELLHTCSEFIDRSATEVINSEAFLSLSSGSIQEIISRVSFCAAEIDIFQAVQKWAAQNEGEDIAPIIRCIRLPLMTLEELLNEVRPSNLVSADVILDAIKVKNESSSVQLQYRGFLKLEENIARLRTGAQVIRGEMKASLLDEDCTNYDLDRGFSRHPIDENNGQGIVIKLANPYIINTIRMLLWDRDMRCYSYYIEVSMDDKDYERVIDYSKYMCRSWQCLHFPQRVVRYIRIVGTYNSVNRVFHLVSVEALYTRKPFKVQGYFTVPSENVATKAASACVLDGVSRSRNALINGDTSNYDWDSGYTCHQLGSGSIVVQLAQPVVVASFRLLLWDCDGRTYSYYIETSTDQQNWSIVADKTKEACRSWQTIVFEARPVTFIRIVGTHNTANEVFHCVHFECPASAAALAEYAASKPSSPALPPPPPPPRTSSSPPPRSPRGGAELQGLDDLESRGDGLVLEPQPEPQLELEPQQMVAVGVPGMEDEDEEEEMEGAAALPPAGAATPLSS